MTHLLVGLPGFQVPEEYANHVWTRAIDWGSLGYGPKSFLQKQQAGFLWMTFMGMFYLLLGVGFPTTLVIYQYQYLPSREVVVAS